MTNTNPLHKNQAGQPSDNGGHFAAKTFADADGVSLTGRPQREIIAFDLEAGDVIIGGDGAGRLRVNGVVDSETSPGQMVVDTDFGPLYLDAEKVVTVATEGEQRLDVNLSSISEDDVHTVWSAARSQLGYQGRYFSKEDVTDILNENFNDGEDDTISEAKLWERVQSSNEWRHLTDFLAERGNDRLYDIVSDAVSEIRIEHAEWADQ